MKTLTLTAGLFALAAAPALAEDRITFVTNWGSNTYSVAYMLDWVERFNAEHDGVAEIRFVGGPEVTPAAEQLTAVRNGVFDMMFGAAGYYVGQVPEAYAIYPSPLTPAELRESGGFDLLAEAYREKAGTELLGWVASGVGYQLWLKTDEVPVDEQGVPDLTGIKMRSSPFYNAWLEQMGAIQVPVPAPDIYSALERGVVDGAAWPALGITDLGWESFIGARIDPPVGQFDNVVLLNSGRWAELSPETQEALKSSLEALEMEARAYYEQLAAEEADVVEAQGTMAFELEGAAREAYVGRATDVMWAELEKIAPEKYEALRAAFGG